MRCAARSVIPIVSPISRKRTPGSWAMQSITWAWLVRNDHVGAFLGGINARLWILDSLVICCTSGWHRGERGPDAPSQMRALPQPPLSGGQRRPGRRSVPRLRVAARARRSARRARRLSTRRARRLAPANRRSPRRPDRPPTGGVRRSTARLMGRETSLEELRAQTVHASQRLALYRRKILLGRGDDRVLASRQRISDGARDRLRRAQERVAPSDA